MEFLTASDAWLARWLFERGLAALCLIAFLSARNQFPALLGERGLLPVPHFLERRTFRAAPSLFHWRYSDRFFSAVAWAGLILSAAVLFGAFSSAPLGVSLIVWLLIYFLYLSIVNVGQRFYSFGWESMMLEAAFFAAFLGPEWMEPSIIPIFVLRWMLFRVEVGAGLIKLRAGGAWRDLTALDYHHETQPMPNPLSRMAHHLPRPLLHGGVVFSHFVQVIVPFGLFFPQPIAAIAGGLIIFHQLLLIVAGNYAWLNWLTVAIAFSAFPNLGVSPPVELTPRPMAWEGAHWALLAATVYWSVKPVFNLCSKNQLMNYCYNSWHLVNTYGAFGSVTQVRYEVVVEGCQEVNPEGTNDWREYEFKGKPGDPSRTPAQVAPYHLRLDWLMWFLPLGVATTPHGILVPEHERWFLRFFKRLLEGDPKTLKLLRRNPFPNDPPRWVRARFYRYWFTSDRERRKTGRIWNRALVDEFTPAFTLEDLIDA